MTSITNIEEAEAYITTFNFYSISTADKVQIRNELNTCETLALQHNAEKILCRTRTYLMYLNIELNKLQAATEIAEQNMQFAKDKQLDDELLYMVSLVAYLYQLTGNLSGAEELIQIALDRIPTIKEDHKISKIYLMVAEQYYFTNNKENCVIAYKKCIEYAIRSKDNIYIAHCLGNYSEKLLYYNQLDNAFNIINSGIKYAAKVNNKHSLNLFYQKLGIYYFMINDFKKSIYYNKKAINYFKSKNILHFVLSGSIDLIKAYISNKNHKKALSILDEILIESNKSSAKTILRDIFQLYANVYEKTKKYELAYNYLLKYNQINNEINNDESEDKIRNLQIQHEVKTIQLERDTATKLAQVKHNFLSNMSHEIRTPINSILGICYLLQQDKLTDKQSNYIQRLHRSGEQLLGIINDVLDISKIEAGKFHIVKEIFSIHKTIQDCIDGLKQKASEKNLDLISAVDSNIPTQCMGDAVRINQILTNLLYNAIKFTEKGSVSLSVSKTVLNTNSYQLIFSITDTGIGMSEAQLSKLFQEYEQAEQTTQIKFGGTGLGLSISKKLIELMNGSIEVSSIPSIGTTFTFYLPIEYSDQELKKTKTTTLRTNKLKDKRIFIADDVEENRLVLKDLLATIDTSIQTEFAGNGQELIDLLQHQLPDIILMDLDMPVLNGFETTAYIQNELPGNKIKIIACTASLLTLKEEELLEMGFSSLLQKPFTIHQLFDILIH